MRCMSERGFSQTILKQAFSEQHSPHQPTCNISMHNLISVNSPLKSGQKTHCTSSIAGMKTAYSDYILTPHVSTHCNDVSFLINTEKTLSTCTIALNMLLGVLRNALTRFDAI